MKFNGGYILTTKPKHLNRRTKQAMRTVATFELSDKKVTKYCSVRTLNGARHVLLNPNLCVIIGSFLIDSSATNIISMAINVMLVSSSIRRAIHQSTVHPIVYFTGLSTRMPSIHIDVLNLDLRKIYGHNIYYDKAGNFLHINNTYVDRFIMRLLEDTPAYHYLLYTNSLKKTLYLSQRSKDFVIATLFNETDLIHFQFRCIRFSPMCYYEVSVVEG